MADRESVFSDPQVIELISGRFIALTGDDWYWRRQQDAVGDFHRHVTDQGPRGGGSGTRQGRYVFTADGKLLGFNNNRSVERLMAMLNEALEQWEELAADPVEMTDGPVELDPRYDRTLPEGVTILRCWTRALDWDPEAASWVVAASVGDEARGGPRGVQAARDHLWLQRAEVDGIADLFEGLAHGGAAALPEAFAMRLARFHLTDNTRGEPPMWGKDEVRKITLEMERIDARRGRITGAFELASADGSRGFKGVLRGYLEITAEPDGRPHLTSFELRALGLHEGEGRYTPGARPGASPLAVVIELVEEPGPADRVPPQASRYLPGYWNAHRE